MSQINVTIPDNLERRLRQQALNTYGGKKGSLSNVVIDALNEHLGVEKIETGDNLDG